MLWQRILVQQRGVSQAVYLLHHSEDLLADDLKPGAAAESCQPAAMHGSSAGKAQQHLGASQPRPPRAHAKARASTCQAGPGYGGQASRTGRLIIPGQPQRDDQSSGRLIVPGRDNGTSTQQRPGPPKMPPGQANFPELPEEYGKTKAPPRNFRPPAGAPQ